MVAVDRDDGPTVKFTFAASHHSYWAEDLAKQEGIPTELVPAPSESDAKCGLALSAPLDRAPRLAQVFRDAGIDYRTWGSQVTEATESDA